MTDFLPECEEQLREIKKREKGLLYGVPVSIKENVACKVLLEIIHQQLGRAGRCFRRLNSMPSDEIGQQRQYHGNMAEGKNTY